VDKTFSGAAAPLGWRLWCSGGGVVARKVAACSLGLAQLVQIQRLVSLGKCVCHGDVVLSHLGLVAVQNLIAQVFHRLGTLLGHVAVLGTVEVFGGPCKRVHVEMDPMLVTSKDVKSPTVHRILDNDMLVLGISVLVDLVKRNRLSALS